MTSMVEPQPKVVHKLLERIRQCPKPQTIVITGASSGIGFQAVKLLVQSNVHHRIVLVCRTEASAHEAVEKIRSQVPKRIETTTTSKGDHHNCLLIPMACDHTQLESVQTLATRLTKVLHDTHNTQTWGPCKGIDVLCLNAGILRPKDSSALFTHDGFEVTFQTNALSPFLIAYTSMDMMNPGGRVVVTTSGLYIHTNICFKGILVDDDDDDGKMTSKTATTTTSATTTTTTTATQHRLLHKGFEMMDGTKFHFKRSYAMSKVCNVALSLSLQQRLTPRNVTVNCFSPGLMTQSGLFRHQTAHDMENALAHSQFVRDNEKSVAWGGGALAYMAVGAETATQSGMYWSDTDSRQGDLAEYGREFSPSPISTQTLPPECAEDLWYLFCQLAGVSYDSILN